MNDQITSPKPSTKSRYAIAQIHIPIEILPDGEWINHNDRITIQIVKTAKLPPISTPDTEKLLETVQKILECSQEDPDQIPCKISLEGMRESDDPLPFTIAVDPASANNKPTPDETVTTILRHLIVSRKPRQSSKNMSFKRHQKTTANNKTKSNRWSVLKKDTKVVEY